MRGNDGPSPVSASERRLERIHSGEPGREERIEELRQELIEKDLRLAELIANHPESQFASRGEVLEECDHDGRVLVALADTLPTSIPWRRRD